MTATAVAAILALFWLAPWSRPLPHWAALSPTAEGEKPAPVVASTPAAPAAPVTSAVPPVSQPAPASPAASTPAATLAAPAAPTGPAMPTVASAVPPTPSASLPATPSAPVAAATPAASPASPATIVTAPSFDVVRVEPSGATIVAGRGAPGSVVTLLDGGQPVAHATIDAGGQFALLPPDLGEGSHYLTLQGSEGAAAVSKQGVAIAVPKAGGTSRPMVAMLAPDQPVRVLSDGSSGSVAAAPGNAAAPPVAIQAVEAARGGKFTASGVAKAGSQSRIYLNGAFLADVTADKDGRWSVRVEKGMRAGQYVVRADELEGDGGKVAHRAEVPFAYPATLGKGTGKQLLMAHAQPTAAPRKGQASGAALPVPPEIASAGTTVSDGATAPAGLAAPSGAGGPATPKSATGKPAVVAGLTPATPAATPGVAAAPATAPVTAAIVPDLKLTTVSRGDSLWRISRKLLGRGIDYTEIYASNTNQIRDPALIYPGQIFVLPQRPAK